MNLYLVGHGFIFCNDKKEVEQAWVEIPDGISVKFYCKETWMFDSSWEKLIMNAPAPFMPKERCPNTTAADEWEVSAYSGSCTEHLLSRPGNMNPYKSPEKMKEIMVLPDGFDPRISIQNFVDGDTLYISSLLDPTCRLSSLLERLHGKGFRGTLHWLACRSIFIESDPKSLPEIEKQARKDIGPSLGDKEKVSEAKKAADGCGNVVRMARERVARENAEREKAAQALKAETGAALEHASIR